jgi:beta-galactosidase
VVDGHHLFDVVRPDAAVPVAEFRDDFYAGSPAVTAHRYGDGVVVYVASLSGALVTAALDRFVAAADSPISVTAGAVEQLDWSTPDDEIVCLLNHGEQAVSISVGERPWRDALTGRVHRGELTVAGIDAVVLRRSR